jgi:hypothetical protein
VGVQPVPDQDDRAAELLVRGVQKAGVVRLGEPLALIAPPGAVRAVPMAVFVALLFTEKD